jgi:hypothetical protein
VRAVAALGMLALTIGTPASADSPFGHRDGDDRDTIVPITSYPLGESQQVASGMARQLRMHWVQRDLCDQLGCLVVHNDTRNYTVAEFRILSRGRDGMPRWGANQLEHPLLPKQQLVQVKMAAADSCNRDIRFVLKHRKTKETLVMESATNLCPTPHVHNVIHLNVRVPAVTVEDEQPQ